MTESQMQQAAEAAAKEIDENSQHGGWAEECVLECISRHFAPLCEDEPITPSEVSQAVRAACAAKDAEIASLRSRLAAAEKVVEAAKDLLTVETSRTADVDDHFAATKKLNNALAEYGKGK